MPTAYINIGSNQGDRHSIIERAIALIEHKLGVHCHRSDYIESDAWGYNSPNRFLNIGIKFTTDLSPKELLEKLLEIQSHISSAPHRNAVDGYIDRMIDIDLIALDEVVSDDPYVILPHPRMHLREFVLIPMIQLAPEWIHPRLHANSLTLLRTLRTSVPQ